MNECERIADQLQRAMEGDAWHGPAVLEALSGVTASQAAAPPPDGGHSIWEIVHHIAVWHTVVRDRIDGLQTHPTGAADWPPVTDAGEAAWTDAVQALKQSYETLRHRILHLPDHRLNELVPGRTYSFYVMMHGAVQHDVYHAGQIILLKKRARRR
ncbi:MAG: DinB family protein [Rhodothermales bacterium]